MRNIFHRFIADESGTGIVEAGVVILVIAVVLMGAMSHQASFPLSDNRTA